jgi:F-type H+-transporting ATPase subunit b
MLHPVLLLLQEAEGHAAGGAGPLTVNGGLVIWTLVVFALLLALLRRFAWPTLLQAVRDRERRLEQQLADAERNRTESAALLEQQKKLLQDAKAEAQEIVKRAQGAGEKEREALLGRARAEYESLLERAQKEIGEERDKAVQALRREAVDLSIAAASKLIDSQLDSAANRRLVQEYLATLEHRK